MDILNLTIEYHYDAHAVKRVVRIEAATKVGEIVRLLHDKFGKGEADASLYQLSIAPLKNSHHAPPVLLSDVNKSLQAYNIKNNDELVFKKRQKKNPTTAKLSKKKPDGIFKTLFSMSTLEMKLSEDKAFVNITDVEGRIEIPAVLYGTLGHLDTHFNSINKDEVSSSFQYYGLESEYAELIRAFNQGDEIDLSSHKNPKLLCNFILYLLQTSLSETSLTYSLYTTFLKASTLESKSNIFYDIPTKNRIVLKHIMLFLSKITSKDTSLLDTIASIIAPFILGRIESPHNRNQSGQQEPSPIGAKVLSPEETALCKKVAIDLIQNISLYLVFSPFRGPRGHIQQLEGERTLFSSENVFCIDKCNFPPSVASLGEIWVTNYRIIYVNAATHTGNAASSSSSGSIQSGGQLPTSLSSNSLRENNNTTAASMGIQASTSQSFSSTTVNLNQRLGTLDNCEIPIHTIYRWKAIKTGPLFESFKIYCKDFRCKVIGFPAASPHLVAFKDLLERVRTPTPATTFAFSSQEALAPAESFTEHLLAEFNRQGVSWDEWRATNANHLLGVTDYYPAWSVVPKSVNDNIVVTSAYYRTYRFPSLSWSHPTHRASITRAASPEGYATPSLNAPMSPPATPGRTGGSSIMSPGPSPRLTSAISSSSIPQVCQEDIDLLHAIVNMRGTGLLSVYDTGTSSSYASSMIGCKLEFLALPTPPVTREAYRRLLHLHSGHPDKRWGEVVRFSWLNNLKPLLAASISIATTVDQGASVLIQHRDEADTDAQLASIAQILLDPHYRTLDGFRTLIEKEWLCHGHPFARRTGHDIIRKPNGPASDPDAFAPIFLQFVFIVWQLWKEFPTSFQFNEAYLLALLDALYTCRFGTFLGNNIKERDDVIFGHTRSFWSFASSRGALFTNALYEPDQARRLLRCERVFQDAMWNEYFYRHCFKSQVAIELLEERVRAADAALTIDLSTLRLYMLPDSSISTMANVRELNLSRNNLNTLPIGFSRLVHLERLSFEDNALVNMAPETLRILARALPLLREINLSGNSLEDLPSTLADFPSLSIVKVRANKFAFMPEVIDRLPHLAELDISSCHIATRIPSGCAHASLTSLNLSATHMVTMPDEIGDLSQLKSLYASDNALTTLPASIAKLAPTLTELIIDGNKLTTLPNEITLLINLERLMLDGNQITSLPSNISLLSQLRELGLKSNRLDSLPASIGQLSQLAVLNLVGNQLTALRPTMGLLANLSDLRLDANPLKTPPPEIVSQGLAAIRDYLRDLIKGQEQCYRMKLMIVGQENVGKTTLIKTLREKKKMRPSTSNISTDGIVIDNWVFPATFEDAGERRKQDVTLSVWDFAGQEIYYTTHQFFLSERSIYIVVWNLLLAEEDSRVEFWLQSITTRTKDAPIIIVGTHLDDSNKAEAKRIKKRMRDKYCTRFPSILAVKTVSCTNGKGVASLRETLENLVASQPNMGESLPRSYMLLENLVKEETKKRTIPTIPWPDFVQLGTICTITDEAELLRATMFLNQLGSLVYFPKEAGLRQLVILEPQWITVMLSSIITTKHSYAKDGVLPHKSLKQVWRAPLYPESLHVHLMALLEKFEISYNLGGRTATQRLAANEHTVDEAANSLIPSLLPHERPAHFASLWPPYDPRIHLDQFGRNYKFEFIPNGFFSRLMVRILNFAQGEARCYWRTGMLLARGEEQILIELNMARKLLSFVVRGRQSASLSRHVIETIQSLLDDSFQLTTQVYIPCIHCILEGNPNPFKFTIEICENAAVKGVPYLKCRTGMIVRTDTLCPDLVMSNFTGSKIFYDQLKLEELIGEGGAALVYRGRWKGHTVAIKKLKTVQPTPTTSLSSIEINDISLSKAFNEFRRECWVMSALEHPNIVQLKGLCLDPLCIVTEYLPQGNLYKFLHSPEAPTLLSWVLRLKIALDIASGMAFLHRSTPPIIHRDLKSPNIMLASIDESAPVIAKVVDFGLSGLQHTITNRGVENPVWLAPEIIDKQEATTQSDIYAFGVILWELLTYRDFFGDLGFMSLLEDKVVAGERPPIPEDCPPAYSTLIQECWQNNPDARPSFVDIEDRIMAIVSDMFPNVQLVEPATGSGKRKSIRHRKQPSQSSEHSEADETDDNSTTTPASTSMSPSGMETEDSLQSSTSTAFTETTTTGVPTSLKSTTTSTTDTLDVSSSSVITASMSFTLGSPNNNSNPNNETLATDIANSGPRSLANSQNPYYVSQSQEANFFKTVMDLNNNNTQVTRQLKPPAAAAATTTTTTTTTPSSTTTTTTANTATTGPVAAVVPAAPEAEKKAFYHNTKRNSVSVALHPHFNEFKKSLVSEEGSIQCMVAVNETVWMGTNNGIITVWSRDGVKIKAFKAHTRRIHCLYPYMDTVWSGSADDNISIWNAETYTLIKTFSGHGPTCFTSIGHTIWVGTIVNAIHIWDIKKKVKYKGKIPLESAPVEAILRREKEVWVALNNNIARIDITTQKVTQLIRGHEKSVHSIIEVDGAIWTCSSDGTIRVWGAASGAPLATIKAHESRVFSMCLVGEYVWSGSWDTTIKIWNIKDYSLVAENRGRHKDAVSSFVYLPPSNGRSKQVWSGSWDSTACCAHERIIIVVIGISITLFLIDQCITAPKLEWSSE
eukprot:gene1517-1772_t